MIKPVRDDLDMVVSPAKHTLGSAHCQWFKYGLDEGDSQDCIDEVLQVCHFLGSGAIKAKMIAT